MKQSGLAFIIVALSLTACGDGNKETASKKDKENYEKTKETLEESEQKSPQDFITISSRDRHNLIGQTVIKYTLHSKATVASYKDIEVELAFYSGTGTLLEKDKETVYKVLGPGASTTEKTKYYTPKGTDSIALKVLNAKNASPE